MAGRGDGRISKSDAETILSTLVDGNAVTEVEYRSAFRCLAEYTWTDEARKLFVERMAKA